MQPNTPPNQHKPTILPSFLLPPAMNNLLYAQPPTMYGTMQPAQVFSGTPVLYTPQQQQQLAQQQQQQVKKKKKKKKKTGTGVATQSAQQSQAVYPNMLLNSNNFTTMPQPWNNMAAATTLSTNLNTTNNSKKQKSKTTATTPNTPTSYGIFNPTAIPSIIPNNMVAIPSVEKAENVSQEQENASKKRKVKE